MPRPRRSKANKRSAPKRSLPTPWDDLRATGRTASRALTIFKGAASLLNAEVKHVDQTANLTPDTSGTVTLLSGIAQGDGNTTRDGTSVKLKGGDLRFRAASHTSAAATWLRLLLVVDTRNDGVNPTLSDIISATITGQPNLDSSPNRFVILHDEVLSLVTAANRIAHRNIPLYALLDMHLMFNGTGATVASCSGPALFAVLLSSEATNTPSVTFDSRLLFLDN